MEGALTVKRQPGDWRTIDVPVADLAGFHMDDVTGGVGRRTSQAVLMAYMWCSSIPEGADFGHSCMHGPPPHRIKVCIIMAGNPGPLYRQIRKSIDPEWGVRKKK